MSDKELLIKELIIKDFNEILVNEFCTDWKEKRLYIELLVRATHFDYLLNYIQEKDKEIERLKERIEDLNTINEEHQILNGMIRKELQQKENIIKEAREYIENNKDKEIPTWSGGDYDYETCLFAEDIKELLEILDKENNDNV